MLHTTGLMRRCTVDTDVDPKHDYCCILQVFKEMHRVMKPGGIAIMSFSNR